MERKAYVNKNQNSEEKNSTENNIKNNTESSMENNTENSVENGMEKIRTEKNLMKKRSDEKKCTKKNNNTKESGLVNGMTPEEYQEYVKQITPVNNVTVDVIRAFITGGIICTVGQAISSWLTGNMDLSKQDAASWTSIILVGISVILTGFNLYSKIVKWGGAGALVPITGFANSVASPAIESQTEGQVFGIGCSIFKIAGPVILYGIFSSWVLGILYWIWQMF
jgi:stage V sporulation protein AC